MNIIYHMKGKITTRIHKFFKGCKKYGRKFKEYFIQERGTFREWQDSAFYRQAVSGSYEKRYFPDESL